MRSTALYRDDGDGKDSFHVVCDDGDKEDMSLIEFRLACVLYIKTEGIYNVYLSSVISIGLFPRLFCLSTVLFKYVTSRNS